ncbi:MAG TPA: complex I subunit 1 family protein [Acidimicrobiia bacterium]
MTSLLALTGAYVPGLPDPLTAGHFSWGVLGIIAVKVLVAFVLLLVSVLLYIWGMRKWIADMQNRVGPERAGPFGVLQTLADGIKLFFKEQVVPETADRPVFRIAPYLSIMPAFLMFCVIPIGGVVSMFGHQTRLQVADLPFGALWILAMSGIGVYGVMLAGWSSGSKYPLLGSVRASAQMLSYEAAFGLGILAALIHTGTLQIGAIVDQQAWTGPSSLWRHWNLFPTVLIPFVIFVIAALAETNHPPFDLVEAEQELVGGFVTEYSGIRFAIFFLAEFMNIITMSAVTVTLFLGGPSGPELWPAKLGALGVVNVWLMPIFWFAIKVIALTYGTVWLRAATPRMRYDRLMSFCWKYLIELAVLWVIVLTARELAIDNHWNVFLVTGATILAGAALYGLLMLMMPRPGEMVEEFR